MEKQLLAALKKNANMIQVVDAAGALKQLSAKPSPSAVYLTHHGFAQDDRVVQRVIEYARAGGRVILGSHFAMDPGTDAPGPFFRNWQLPWTAGALHRTIVALAPPRCGGARCSTRTASRRCTWRMSGGNTGCTCRRRRRRCLASRGRYLVRRYRTSALRRGRPWVRAFWAMLGM